MKATHLSFVTLWSVASFLALSWAPHTKAAQFVEVTAEIEGTFWPVRGAESRRTYTTRCIIGTNIWMLEGDFARNSTTTYWYTGTNLIRHVVITKKLSESRSENIGGPVSRVPEVGERFTSARGLSDGGPTDGSGYENVLWLAFCSGAYLKKDGRRIPPPIGGNRRARDAQDYSQTISLFEDALALPKSIRLHTPDKHLLCHYEALQSTNVAGWSLPQRFKVTQYRPSPNGVWELHAEAVGRLTSALSADEPKVPAKVLNQVKE